MQTVVNLTIRLSFWFLFVAILLIPSLRLSDAQISVFNFQSMARNINESGNFSSLYFIVVVISALSLMNIYNNIASSSNTALFIKSVYIISSIIFVLTICLGTLHYVDIVPGKVVDPQEFSLDLHVILIVLGFSAFMEIVIGLSSTELL